jgi:hypothetical protein
MTGSILRCPPAACCSSSSCSPSPPHAKGSALHWVLLTVLGFLALAGGTLVLSGLQLGWVEAAESANVAVVLIAFVFPLQLLASILGYLARDVVAGTGMGILSGTWLAVGLVLFRSQPGATSDALGLLLLASAAAMCVPAAGALLGKLVPAAVLFTTATRYAVTGCTSSLTARRGRTPPATSDCCSAASRSTPPSPCCSTTPSGARSSRCCDVAPDRSPRTGASMH